MYRVISFRDDEYLGRVAKIEFTYKGDAEYVYLVGSFNAFNEGSFRMRKVGDNWKVEIELPEGIWYYGFAVNGILILDKENPERIQYERRAYKFGNTVSVCKALSFKPDNCREICREALYHYPALTYAYPFQDWIFVRFRTLKNNADSVYIITEGDKIRMNKKASDEVFDYYEVVLPHVDELSYSFEVIKGKEKVKYGSFSVDFSKRRDNGPEWVYESVFYQIMPDRFANGDVRYDPNDVRELHDWRLDHHGGDLIGLTNKLDYLEKLGVNAIYLTPIFPSKTYHSYDVEDYYNVDLKYGGNEAFERFMNESRKRGIKIILDGVFHHTSFFHPYFQDIVQNDQSSAYKDWYRIIGFPVIDEEFKEVLYSNLPWPEKSRKLRELKKNYESFFGVWIMPRLNHDNPKVVEFIKNVGLYWVQRYKTNGWRLDVAHGVPPRVWKEFRENLPENVYLIGEVMDDARLWIFDKFHGIMNYPLYEALLRFFVYQEMTSEEFLNWLELLSVYYGPNEYLMYNFLDNHDVSRFLSLVEDRQKYKCALFFLVTYKGVPSIFYGDEIGIKGIKRDREEQREPMIWEAEKWDRELLEFTRRLIRLRRNSKALQRGIFKSVEFKDGLLIYERVLDGEIILIAINYSEKERYLNLPPSFEILFQTGLFDKVNNRLGAFSSIIARRL